MKPSKLQVIRKTTWLDSGFSKMRIRVWQLTSQSHARMLMNWYFCDSKSIFKRKFRAIFAQIWRAREWSYKIPLTGIGSKEAKFSISLSTLVKTLRNTLEAKLAKTMLRWSLLSTNSWFRLSSATNSSHHQLMLRTITQRRRHLSRRLSPLPRTSSRISLGQLCRSMCHSWTGGSTQTSLSTIFTTLTFSNPSCLTTGLTLR